ncbi:TMV resistance protein N-like [Prosopis cineraria]|uniref:TMV resistance protein N-like n=1 Tax=Prosopis cineraria TaxID=364024 RepID=UPI00240EC010|nr:TMV resistance protein N-like [Prosopis cineraria]XP_054794536.1 TMV resistance protein N-like [Prosopis cineraria]
MEYTVYGESSSSFDALNSSPKWKYDVFLSFAGKDTRLKFTDHLYDAFNRSGIRAFRDDEGIERGEDLSKQLLQAIEDSLCAVVVLSENYANSKWCLNELQKILECRNKLGQRVFPIFYDVDPSDIRYQRKSFGEALAKHEERFRNNNHNHKGLGWFSAFANLGLGFKQRFWLPNTHSNMFKLQTWKKALFEIGNLSGWDTRGRRESDLIKNIVGGIWTYLCSKLPTYGDNLVGIESKMVDMMSYLEIGLDDVYFVGLWGMGGIGKTTLARVVYDKISHKFDMCCFLANVRETSQREGLVSLHRKLLSHLKIKNMEIDDVYEGKKILQNLFFNKKVLLVLDDVDHMKQIQILAQSPKWFGRGSRVIITTRDSHLLTTSKVQRIYEVKIMKEEESLQLLSNKAFNQDHPKIDYLELSISVVKYTGGLPLALNVLGSFLCGRSKAEWRDTLDRLKQIPDNDILQILKISYDGLNEEEKTIFLDIACFFKGWRKVEVAQILEDCDLHPTIGMKVLMEKALLIEKKDLLGRCVLEMHDLLEDLGRYIICQESPNAGQRSRLWELEDINEVLKNKKGSKAMQAIVYRYLGDDVVVHPQVFSETSNIRLLILSRDFKPFGGLKCLPSALKVFQWREFPLETLPFEAPLDKLVDIQMHKSKIKKLWNGVQFMKKLKRIDLSYSRYLNETPDFSEVPNLEKLILEGCSSLVKVHPSLGKLHKVVLVNLCNCKNLKSLPRKLEMNSLIELNLFGCSKVELLPEFGEGMKNCHILK